MLILIVLIALVVTAGVTLLIIRAGALRRPADLRGDWWSAFEQDFRAYVAARARSDHSPHRRHSTRGE